MNVVIILFAYLIGAIPTGYWFAKYLFNVDVTKHGSKNIGATNVARVLGSKAYFFVIFFFDFIKAFLVLYLAHRLGARLELAAFALLVGNGCSVFLRFRGGKGVATVSGILAYMFPWLFTVFVVSWIVLLGLCKRVFIASLGGLLMVVPAYYVLYGVDALHILFLIGIWIWIVLRHVPNIRAFCQLPPIKMGGL